MKTKEEVINILKRVGETVHSEIIFPVKFYNSPDYMYLEIITGEERENGDNNSICFGFRIKKGKLVYDYCVYPSQINGKYEGNDFSVEALTKYTIDRINNHRRC